MTDPGFEEALALEKLGLLFGIVLSVSSENGGRSNA